MVRGLYFLSELIVMDSFYFLVGPHSWISVHHSVTRVLISSIFLMCMRLECTIIKQNKTKRSKVKTILFQSRRHKKRIQSSQSKSHVNHFLRPPGCHIFSTFSMIERFFYQKVIEVEDSLAA